MLGRRLEAQGVFFRLLDLDYAFHSAVMDPLEEGIAGALADVKARDAAVRFVSTVTGADHPGPALDATYWWRNVREPVRFGDAVTTLARDGIDVFVELGPHGILQDAPRGFFDFILKGDAGGVDDILQSVDTNPIASIQYDW